MKVKAEPTCGVECLLYKTCRSPYMELDGNLDAPLLLVGEAPGEDEDDIGKPFVGRAGELLKDTLRRANILDFAITNAIRCRPPKNRTPTTKEIAACNKFLKADIDSMPNLKLIVLFGNIALQAVLGIKGGITKYSGKLMDSASAVKIMPILHPAYILRNQDEYHTFCDHISRIPNAITGSLIDTADFGTYSIIKTFDEWKELADQIKLTKEFVYDLETNCRSPFEPQARIKCIGFLCEPRHAWVLPFEEKNWSNAEWCAINADLDELMSSKRIRKIGHNLKFDNLWLKKMCGLNPKTSWDTSISQFLLNENESTGLKDMAWKYTKIGGYETLLGDTPQNAEGEKLYVYCGTDCDVTERIYGHHRKALGEEGNLFHLFHNLFIPVSNVFTNMEYRGIRIDPSKVLEAGERTDNELQQLYLALSNWPSIRRFEKDTGTTFNPNSHIQLREVLYKYEGLPILKKTEKSKAPSTSVEVLKEIADTVDSKLINLLIEHSAYSSLKSKMLKELAEFKTADDRIHTNYWLTQTVTGRSSSSRPNLQNVTKGRKDKVGIRKCFVADPDCLLVEFDYNQHELRCMAEEAQDLAMMEALAGDVHVATTSELKRIKPEEVTEDDRRDIGKTFNFGLIYGLTLFGIKKRLRCTEIEAQGYLDRFFAKYYKIKQWMDATIAFVRKNHYVESRTGQRRRFPVWDEVDEKLCREAVNMPIQNLAGHILLYSLIAIEKYLTVAHTLSTLNLEVHDSVILNVHKNEMDIIPTIKEIMLTYFLNFIPFGSPLGVDVKIGENWGEMENFSK